MTAYEEMYNRIYAATFGGLVAKVNTSGGALSGIAKEAETLTHVALVHWSNTAGERQRQNERHSDLADLTKRVEALEAQREEKRASN